MRVSADGRWPGFAATPDGPEPAAQPYGRSSQHSGAPFATRVCHAFQKAGWCRWGTKCRYSHDPPEHAPSLALASRLWSERKVLDARPKAPAGLSRYALGKDALPSRAPLPPDTQRVRIMSYNMLADSLAIKHARELYRAVPHWCLDWRHRLQMLVSEIEHWRPDIASLQECDHLDDFKQALGALGYEGAFVARGGSHTDGCFTCWRTDVFREKEAHRQSIIFEDFKLRENVASLVLLEPRCSPGKGPPGPLVLVANTHLLFNPKRGDIKIGQARIIAERMAAMRASAGVHVALFLMGDFNSTAGSAIYRFLTEGFLDCAGEDRRDLSGQLAHEHDQDFSKCNVTPQGWTPTPPTPTARDLMPPPPAPFSHPLARGAAPTLPFPPHPSAAVPIPLSSGGSASSSNPCTPRVSLEGVREEPHPPHPGVLRGNSLTEGPLSRGGSGSWRGGGVQHSVSFPCMPAMAEAGSCSLDDLEPRYLYVDQFGQQTWSHVPPPQCLSIPRHMFFHDPMYCEEASPAGPPPASILRTPSEYERRKNLSTWSLEQLQNALGPSAPTPTLPFSLPASRANSSALSLPRDSGTSVKHPSGIPTGSTPPLPSSTPPPTTGTPPLTGGTPPPNGTLPSEPTPPKSHFLLSHALSSSSRSLQSCASSATQDSNGPVPEEGEILADGKGDREEGTREQRGEQSEQGEDANPSVSGRELDASTAASVRAAAAAIALRAANEDPVVRQALAARRSSEWAGTTTGVSGGVRKSSRELSRRGSFDLASQQWVAKHPLHLRSATLDILGRELPYTSCHGKFIGCVDFCFFNPHAGSHDVVPQRVLLPPPLESLQCGLPSPQWPSDHISLVFDFHLVSKRES